MGGTPNQSLLELKKDSEHKGRTRVEPLYFKKWVKVKTD